MNKLGGVLEKLRRALTPKGRAAAGRFLIEGTRLHERALRAGLPVEQVLLSESYLQDPAERTQRLLSALRTAGSALYPVPDQLLQEFTEGRSIGELVGLVPFPEPAPLKDLLQSCQRRPFRILVAVEVEDPGNTGALVRTALASGAAAFVAVGISDPFHPKAVRTSMGSLFKLPLYLRPDSAALLSELRTLGILSVGAVSSGGDPVDQADWSDNPLAILLGSEAFGLDDQELAALDRLVTIPMAQGIDSFSVNAAAAVLLYAACKRS